MSMISVLLSDLDGLRSDLKQGAYDSETDPKIITEAINTIKELSAKLSAANMERSSMYYNGGWIPVWERSPGNKINPFTHDGYVYPVTYKNGNVTDIRYYTYTNGQWYHGAEVMDRYVIAWMPLPEPYKSKESREDE